LQEGFQTADFEASSVSMDFAQKPKSRNLDGKSASPKDG
jgi:hypothetical protein